jgi:hypothetical protein
LYASPYLLYRHAWILSITGSWEGSEEQLTRDLDVFAGGVLIGWRLAVIKGKFSIDTYFGAGMRLAKYADESHLTRFKSRTALDYSGVTPTGGISVGILK